MTTKSQVLSADPNRVLDLIDGWKKSVDTLEQQAETYKRYVERPGGSYWEGVTAEAAQNRAAQDYRAVVAAHDTMYSRAGQITNAVSSSLIPPLSNAKQIIANAEASAGVTVNEDLSIVYTAPAGTSKETADANHKTVAAAEAELKAEAANWWEAENDVAQQIRDAESAVSKDLSFGAALYDVSKALPARPAGQRTLGDIEQSNLRLLDQLQQEYSQLPPGQIRNDRLADIAGVREALKTRDSHLIYLAKPDDPSQMIPAATAIGDPFKADHVSVTVPGVSGTTRQSLATMTNEARQLQLEAQKIAQKTGDSQNVSTIAWLGYQPPLSLISPETATDALARANAPKLESFLSNLNATSTNPNHTTALFGHSYGSLLSGIALKDGASADVTNVVLYGSPGFEATSPAQLGMSDNHFFVMSAHNDLIAPIGALAPLHGWGADPNAIIYGDTDRYRFTHLETQAGQAIVEGRTWDLTGASGHSEYGRDPLQRITGYNLADVLLNRPDLTVRVTMPSQ